HARLHQQAAVAIAPTDEARRAREERHRLFAGAVPRRKQLLVEVEERDGIGCYLSVERGLGADDHGTSSQAVEVLLHARHTGTEDLQPRRPAGRAHRWAFLLAAPAHERGLQLRHDRAAVLAAGELTACGACQQPGPTLAVEDAHDPALAAQQLHEALG